MSKRSTIGEIVVYPAKGGLETVSIPGTTTLGRLSEGRNFMVDINGAKKKNPGTIQQDVNPPDSLAPAGNARALFDYWRTTGTAKTRRTVFGASGKFYADNSDGLYLDITGPFSILATDNVAVETFFGLLLLAFDNNPGGTPLKWTQSGTLAALGGTPPNAKYLRTFLNRLWVTGVGAFPDRLYASAIGNPEDWTLGGGAFTVDIDQGDQDPVGNTSIFPPFYGRMIVAKRRSLYEITPSGATFALRNIITGLGCVSHNGVASIDSDIIFPSERGISTLGMTDKLGQVDTAFASSAIQDLYQDIVSFDRAGNMRSIYVPELNSYLLALTTKNSLTNDVVLGYNFALGEWYQWDLNVSAFARFVDSNDSNKTKVLVANDQGKIGILDTSKRGRTVTWFGERLTMQFSTGIIYPLAVRKEVTFRKLTVYYKPSVQGSKLLISYRVNSRFVEDLEFDMSPLPGAGVIGSAVIGVDRIGTSGVIKHVTRNLRGVGEAIELIFTHTPVSDDDDCEIYGFVLEFEYSGETDLPKQQ
jgi:hypothetical protein